MDEATIALAGAMLKAKRSRPLKGKRRRLLNVAVDEISLVDNPAVPEATFLIAKRDAAPEDLGIADQVAHAAKLIARKITDNAMHLKALSRQADRLLAGGGTPAPAPLDDPRVVDGFRRLTATLDRVGQQQEAITKRLAGPTPGSGGPTQYRVLRGGRQVWTHAKPRTFGK